MFIISVVPLVVIELIEVILLTIDPIYTLAIVPGIIAMHPVLKCKNDILVTPNN